MNLILAVADASLLQLQYAFTCLNNQLKHKPNLGVWLSNSDSLLDLFIIAHSREASNHVAALLFYVTFYDGWLQTNSCIVAAYWVGV